MRKRDSNSSLANSIKPTYLLLLILVPVAILILLGVDFNELHFPLANGDLLNTYRMQETFWKQKSFINPNSGYPSGMDTRVWPYLDPLPSALTGIFYFATKNIILSVNLVFIFSFSICALIVWLISSEIKLSKSWKTFTVISCLTLPWIPGRIEHFDFTYISLVLLPLYFYLKRENARQDLILISIAGMACALTNPYIAVFAMVNLFFAFAHNYLTYKNGEKAKLLSVGAASIILGFALNLKISTFGFNGEVFPGFHRSLSESVNLAGYFFVLVSPVAGTKSGPISRLLPDYNLLGVGKEPTMESNFGSWILVASLLVIIYLSCKIYMGKLDNSQLSVLENRIRKQTLYLLLILLAGNTLFFLKGGFGIFISAAGFSFIRSWNRLTPIIQILMIISSVFFLQNWSNINRKWWVKVIAGVLLVSQLQAFSSLGPSPRKQQQIVAQNYVDKISQIVYSPCGILQLPEISYPQNGNFFRMHDYDPFILQITNNKFGWSYGHPKNSKVLTRPISDIQKIEELKANEFCGISLDSFGVNSLDTLNTLKKIYGPPKVQSSDNRYYFFSIPEN